MSYYYHFIGNYFSQVTEITQTIETLKINAKEAQDNSDSKLESLGNKIDETLSESINILKNDYEKKVSDVQTSLIQFQRETIQESEQRMESLLMEKMGLVNNNLMEEQNRLLDGLEDVQKKAIEYKSAGDKISKLD